MISNATRAEHAAGTRGRAWFRLRRTDGVIPGRAERASPESILTIVVMDSGLALRAPPERRRWLVRACPRRHPLQGDAIESHEGACNLRGKAGPRIEPTHLVRPVHRQADGHNLGGMKGIGDVPLGANEFAVPALLMGVVSDIASKRPAMLHIASHLPEKHPLSSFARPESRVRKRWSTYVVHL